MGDQSRPLLKLRPVSFRYNNDPTDTLQYGLVAEVVAKIYPELVVHGADGQVQACVTRCLAQCSSTSCRSGLQRTTARLSDYILDAVRDQLGRVVSSAMDPGMLPIVGSPIITTTLIASEGATPAFLSDG